MNADNRNILVILFAVFMLAMAMADSAIASPPDLKITTLQLVSSKRISLTVYEYTYRAILQNDGGEARDVVATVASTPIQIETVDGELTFGLVSPGQTSISTDTFIVRHDRTKPFDKTMVVWSFDYSADALTALDGAPNDSVTSRTRFFYSGDTVEGTEFSPHPELGEVARTKLTLVMDDLATVQQVNQVLSSTNTVITSMLSDSAIFGLRIPDVGDTANLDTLIARMKAYPGVADVLPVVQLREYALPDNPGLGGQPPLSQLVAIRHHLAIGAHAVWNIRDALKARSKSAPRMVILDKFGLGAPQNALWSFLTNPLQYTIIGNILSDEAHGYQVASVIGANFGGAGSESDLVTGFYPEPLELTAVDLLRGLDPTRAIEGWDASAVLFQRLEGITKSGRKAVLNLSLGDCDQSATAKCVTNNYKKYIVDNAGIWIKTFKSKQLDSKVFVSVAAGNMGDTQPKIPAQDAGYFQRAFLGPLNPGDKPLTNGLVVGSLTSDQTILNNQILNAVCNSEFSSAGADIGGIGETLPPGLQPGVLTLGSPTGAPRYVRGTSFAAPQIAALAATAWTLRPDLTPQELVSGIKNDTLDTHCTDANQLPLVDAYNAILQIDYDLQSPQHAPVRMAILDVVKNNRFDINDVRKFLSEFRKAFNPSLWSGGKLDFSRYDLNGDGYTGGISTKKTRLFPNNPDADKLPQKIDVRDHNFLCFYVNSNLYTANTGDKQKELHDAGLYCPNSCSTFYRTYGTPIGNITLTSSNNESAEACAVNILTAAGSTSASGTLFKNNGTTGNCDGGNTDGCLGVDSLPGIYPESIRLELFGIESFSDWPECHFSIRLFTTDILEGNDPYPLQRLRLAYSESNKLNDKLGNPISHPWLPYKKNICPNGESFWNERDTDNDGSTDLYQAVSHYFSFISEH